MDTFATCLNNVSTTLAQNHIIGDGQLVVSDASKISLPSTGWIRVTLVRLTDNAYCIFRVNSVIGNTLSDLSIIEGTSDINGSIGDRVEVRITAGHFVDIHENILYSTTTPVTANIGDITIGQTFTTIPITTVIDLILHPYQYPSFDSFGISGAVNQEVGQTFSGDKVFNWSTLNSDNINVNSISIVDTTHSVTLASGLPNTGSTTIMISTTASSPSANVWTIQAENTNSQNFSKTTSINWYFLLYYGTSNSTTLISDDIKNLSNSILTNQFSRTYNFSSGGYKYFCWPDSFGGVSLFRDYSTNLSIPMADISDDSSYSNIQNGYYYSIVSVTNDYSVTTNYRVYRTKNILGGSINIIVS